MTTVSTTPPGTPSGGVLLFYAFTKGSDPTEPRYVTENEQKLTVLYALHTLGPVTDQQLIIYLTLCDLMNWFDMKLSLADLQDRGLITPQAHPVGDLWLVTEDGRFCLRQFAGRIPVSKRDAINAHAEEWRLRFRNLRQSPTEMIPLEDGRLCLQLRLTEDTTFLMDLTVFFPAGTEVHNLTKKWEQNAPTIYREILADLTCVCANGASESPLFLLEGIHTQLLLLLPGASEADRPALTAQWQLSEPALMARLQDLLI